MESHINVFGALFLLSYYAMDVYSFYHLFYIWLFMFIMDT